MKEILDYLTRYFAHHSHYAITVRVLECLQYIEQDVDNIAAKVGSKDMIRHPTNHLAFHLAGYHNAGDAKRELLDLVNEVRKCFSEMIAIADETIRNQVITFLLNNINDSKTGCMEARLRPALMSYALYLNVGCHDLHSHMEAFTDQHPELKVVDVLAFFGMQIQHHVLVKDSQGDTVPLTWSLVKNYLSRILAWDSIDDDWREALHTLTPPKIIATHRWYLHLFNHESDARLYLTYINSLLIEHYPDLILAEVKYDAANRVYSFRLTEGQFHAFKFAVSAMADKGKEEINDPLQNDNNKVAQATAVKVSHIEQLTQLVNNEMKLIDLNVDGLNAADQDARRHQIRSQIRHKAARHVQRSDFIVKTLRVDEHCYYRRFIETISAPYEKHTLRRGLKKQYTVTGHGVFRRMHIDYKSPIGAFGSLFYIAPNAVKVSQYKLEDKSGFSKIQSATLGMPHYYPLLFGFTKRRDKLVGIMTDVSNVLFSDRLYLYDGGTVDRPYDFDDYQAANKYFQDKAGRILYSCEQLEEFKACILQNPKLYNEAMVRLRWGSNKTSRLFIGGDSLLARLWAAEYARIEKNHLVANKLMTADEDIPIIYYFPDNPDLHLKVYTKAEMYLDLIEAYQLYSDPSVRHQYFTNRDYEILLAVPREELLQVFRENFNGVNLILKMITDGYAHLVVSLLEIAGDDYRDELTEALKQALHQQESLSLVWSVLFQCDKAHNYELFALIRDLAPLKRSLAYMEKIKSNELDAYYHQSTKHNYTNYIQLFMLNVHKNKFSKARTQFAAPDQKQIALAMRSAIDMDDVGVVLGLIRYKHIDLESVVFPFLLGESDDYATQYYPLCYAAKHGKLKVVNALLALGRCNVNMIDRDGTTALMLAASAGHVDVVKALLTCPDIEVNRENHNLITAIMKAATAGRAEVVKVLLAHPEIKTDRVLSSACYGGWIEVVKVCCERPSLNLNNNSLNAVMSVYEKNELEIFSILLSHPDFNQSHVEIAFRNAKLQDDTRLFLLNHSKFNADLGSSSTVNVLLKMAKNSKYADAVLEYLHEKYLPQYLVVLNQREGEFKHFYGRWFGIDKEKKLNAVNALLADHDLEQHQEALSEGALGNAMKILNQCRETLNYRRRLKTINLRAPG